MYIQIKSSFNTASCETIIVDTYIYTFKINFNHFVSIKFITRLNNFYSFESTRFLSLSIDHELGHSFSSGWNHARG